MVKLLAEDQTTWVRAPSAPLVQGNLFSARSTSGEVAGLSIRQGWVRIPHASLLIRVKTHLGWLFAVILKSDAG